MIDAQQIAIAIAGGAVAGAINTLAGNGSAITLTILTEVMGLPGNLANGTNRIGIFFQSLVGARTFYRHGRLDWPRSRPLIFLMVFGAIAGVWTATQISNEQFRSIFRFLMIVMLFVILVKPKRWLRETDPDRPTNWWLTVPLFLALGFYGGFIQMGMGIFFLAIMVLFAHYSLVEANAVKLTVIANYTLLVIVIFQWQGLIDWKIGLIMAVGQAAGGWLTATFAAKHPKANVWAHRLLVVMVVAAIVHMFGVVQWLIG